MCIRDSLHTQKRWVKGIGHISVQCSHALNTKEPVRYEMWVTKTKMVVTVQLPNKSVTRRQWLALASHGYVDLHVWTTMFQTITFLKSYGGWYYKQIVSVLTVSEKNQNSKCNMNNKCNSTMLVWGYVFVKRGGRILWKKNTDLLDMKKQKIR